MKFHEIKNKISTNHDCNKYITTQEFNKLTPETFSKISICKFSKQI